MIRDISFTGVEAVSLSEIQEKTNQNIEGKYLRLLPKNNFFFLSQESLISEIRNLSPKVRGVSIDQSFPSGMEIGIDERPTIIIWRSSNGEFLLNEKGFIENHPNLKSVYDMPYTFFLSDEEGRESSAGDRVAEGDIPSFVGNFSQKFESRFGKTLSRDIRLPLRFSGELLFHVENGFEILLDSRRPVDDILTTLQAAMERGIPETDRELLGRIDLRTENRVYYTLKNNEQGAESNEQETENKEQEIAKKK